MHEPMRSPCARLVLLMHSLERADNWRTMIGNYTRQRSVCSILIIWNNVNATMPAVLHTRGGSPAISTTQTIEICKTIERK